MSSVADRNDTQDGEMAALALQLSVKSTVTAQRYAGGTAKGHPSTAAPPGVGKRYSGHYELEQLLGRYEQAISDHGREQVIKDTRAELASWRRTEAATGDGISMEQVIIEDGVGHSAEMVAQRYGLSEHHVRRMRKRHERSIVDGTPVAPKIKGVRECTLSTQDKRAEVARMHAKGMTLRQMAMVLRCNESSVRYDLRQLGLKP